MSRCAFVSLCVSRRAGEKCAVYYKDGSCGFNYMAVFTLFSDAIYGSLFCK